MCTSEMYFPFLLSPIHFFFLLYILYSQNVKKIVKFIKLTYSIVLSVIIVLYIAQWLKIPFDANLF